MNKIKLTFILLFIYTIQINGQQRVPRSSEFDQALNKYATVMYYINKLYIDTVNTKNLVDKAIISTLSNLDPHSTYVSKKDFQAMNELLEGSFNGIGIEFNILNDTLTIISPITGGPSEKIGILSGDRIIAVDEEVIAGVKLSNEKAFKLLRGPKDTRVKLTIYRKYKDETIDFEVTRDKIPINSIEASYEIKPGIAYIKLSRFAINSVDEFKNAFTKFTKQPEYLILDLRNNGGGILPVGVSLADQFFDRDKLLVYTDGLNHPKTIELSTSDGVFKSGKLIVLIDEGSASASEIVAGAIQDWDRGILIGRRSFGKGLVQQQLPLSDSSVIRLTVARYHTPTGRVIQRPYNNGETENYYSDLYKRFSKNGEVFDISNIKFPDSLKYTTLKNRRIVYGGGGIMPDIFVPLDTSTYSKYSSQLARKGIINQFIMNYMENNRNELKKQYKSFNEFEQKFTITNQLFNELVSYAETKGIPKNEQNITISENDIKTVMKAFITRDLFSSNEYYKIINTEIDNIYKKAIDVINNWDFYNKNILYPN